MWDNFDAFEKFRIKYTSGSCWASDLINECDIIYPAANIDKFYTIRWGSFKMRAAIQCLA